MQYLLQSDFAEELSARKAYLFRTLSLWTTSPKIQDQFLALTSIPTNALDILFIVGHNFAISQYLSSKGIQESTIVIISCRRNLFIPKDLSQNKTLYISKQSQGGASLLLKGSEFKFPFDPTESELMFYNNRNIPDISMRLKQAFHRIN